MDKLSIYVCENFAPEYKLALETLGFTDAVIKTYPSLCEKKRLKTKARNIFLDDSDGKSGQLFCNKNCDALKLLPEHKEFKKITGQYCYSSFCCNAFLEQLIAQGSYILTSEWLKNWKEHISLMGFTNDMAKVFFQNTCKQLVLLDSGIYKDSEILLKELSSHLGLPYLIVNVDLEGIKLRLKNAVLEWRLSNKTEESLNIIKELRTQIAEYSAVFILIDKIPSFSSKRNLVDRIRELFLMIFGAANFSFWDKDLNTAPNEIKTLLSDEKNLYQLFKQENRFIIKIQWDKTVYGVFDVSGFLFSQYIEKYLNFAIEISKYCGLALHNNEQYEKIIASEQQMSYLSVHDSLTGLYNRAYINQIMSDIKENVNLVVFMFDIDKLKYVNDNFGHSEGDKLIYNCAKIIKDSFRETDIVARMGGDEFTAIMYDTDIEEAEKVNSRFKSKIDIFNENIESEHLKISVSIGFSALTNKSETLEDAIKKADELMYADKMSKRKQL